MENEVNAPQDAYVVFAGTIDQNAVQKMFNSLTGAISANIGHVHLLFQSFGGTVGDGVCLYNFFKFLPINLTIYNSGSVQSIATLAFLGAKNRKASANATFMIHKTRISPQHATASVLDAVTDGIRLDDDRTEAIFKNNLTIPRKKWLVHGYADLWFSANDAKEIGLIHEIGDFSPPIGAKVYNI